MVTPNCFSPCSSSPVWVCLRAPTGLWRNPYSLGDQVGKRHHNTGCKTEGRIDGPALYDVGQALCSLAQATRTRAAVSCLAPHKQGWESRDLMWPCSLLHALPLLGICLKETKTLTEKDGIVIKTKTKTKQNKEILSFAVTWMDLEGIMLSEIERERQILSVWYYLWMESKNSNINTENRLMAARGGGWRRLVKVVKDPHFQL